MKRQEQRYGILIEVYGEMKSMDLPGAPTECKTIRWLTAALTREDTERLRGRLEEQLGNTANVSRVADHKMFINAPSGHVLNSESSFLHIVGTVIQAFNLALS